MIRDPPPVDRRRGDCRLVAPR